LKIYKEASQILAIWYSLHILQYTFWFLVVIASIVAEHYTGNILLKGNQFNTKVRSLLGVDRD
jgi:hypothetical protein